MVSALFSLALLQSPPGQNFRFVANYAMGTNELYVGVFRPQFEENRKMVPAGTPRTPIKYPPFKWTIADAQLRFVPLSGQGTSPKVAKIKMPKPHTEMGWSSGKAELSISRPTSDWTGCRPGFYRMDASVRLSGEGRVWTMKFDHQVFYWRPMNYAKRGALSDGYDKVGQPLLLIDRKPGRFRLGDPKVMASLYGTILTVVSVGSLERGFAPVRLVAEKDGAIFRTSLMGNFDSLPPVVADSGVLALRRRYLGKTVYPMGHNVVVQTDSGGAQALSVKRGAQIVVRDIWRASRPLQLGHVASETIGGKNYLLSGWYPLFVVFDVKTPKLMFTERRGLDYKGPFIALVVDDWAMERQFSLTSLKADFPTWKPRQGLKEPTFPETGFSPKQLAWMRGWPTYVGSPKSTLGLTEWRYEPEGGSPSVFKFKNGKLLPGPGVVPR